MHAIVFLYVCNNAIVITSTFNFSVIIYKVFCNYANVCTYVLWYLQAYGVITIVTGPEKTGLIYVKYTYH